MHYLQQNPYIHLFRYSAIVFKPFQPFKHSKIIYSPLIIYLIIVLFNKRINHYTLYNERVAVATTINQSGLKALKLNGFEVNTMYGILFHHAAASSIIQSVYS